MIKASPVLFVSAVVLSLLALFASHHQQFVAASLSFASIGDWGCVPIGGWHEQDQFIVAKQFAQTAAEIDAQFVLNTGDNFYYCGIESKYDQWWNTTFENVYSEPSMMVPWFNCLGNHDYGYPTSVQSQIDYKSPNKDRWIMPDRYYYRRIEFPGKVNISLVVLDSSPCQSPYRSSDPSGYDPCGSVIPGCPGCTFHQNVINQSCTAQTQWLNTIIPTIPDGDWKILMTHAPAMDLDVTDMVSEVIAGKFDMYINGHVHLMAHYQIDGKGTYITTGGGCMVRVPQSEEDIPELERQAKLKKEGKHEELAKSDKILLKELEQGDEMMKLRKNKKASSYHSSSCTTYNKNHQCSIVYEEKLAGYSTHTFSEDFKQLTTYLYNWEGKLLHQVTTEKGTGGEPGSDSSSSSSGNSPTPSPNAPPTSSPSSSQSGSMPSGCCEMNQKGYCPPGQQCCSERGNPYDEYNCNKYGYIRGCVWEASTKICHVKLNNESDRKH